MNSAILLFVSLLEQAATLPRWRKQAIVFATDLVLLIASIWIAYSLRIGVWVLWSEAIRAIAIGAALLMVPSFVLAGVYRTIFRYAGTGLLRILVRAFLAYTAGMFAIYMVVSIPGVPRTIGLLQPLIFFMLVAAARVIVRFLLVDLLGRQQFGGEPRRVIIYGADTAGQQLAASMRSDPEMLVVGYVDDDKRLHGQKLDGDRVHWSDELPELIQRHEVTDVILAMPSMSRSQRQELIRELSPLKVNVKTLPQTKDILGGQISFSDIRPLEIEDLLGREPVAPNELLLGRTIVGKTVMVTGAGGSIGSELCRQIVRIGARKLVLFEGTEFSLYAIEGELRDWCDEHGATGIRIEPVLGSVTDPQRLAETFDEHAVDTLYHAAAYKHVPLVELNPVEAIRNNVIGTWQVLTAAHRAGVADMILISTDKAVRPTNVMGATKRGAEQILQSFHARDGTMRCSIVRFGNVLGSSGSVVPLFRRQIDSGGPITLTHNEITRFFMTIPEAANLVIQAGGLAHGGETFVLDMGKPVRIRELARTMVQLSGLSVRDHDNPDGDIEIVEVGLRPGEKLYEELLIGEHAKPTKHPRIMMAHEHFMPWPALTALLDRIRECREPDEALRLLRRLVPEFEHRRDNDEARRAC